MGLEKLPKGQLRGSDKQLLHGAADQQLEHLRVKRADLPLIGNGEDQPTDGGGSQCHAPRRGKARFLSAGHGCGSHRRDNVLPSLPAEAAREKFSIVFDKAHGAGIRKLLAGGEQSFDDPLVRGKGSIFRQRFSGEVVNFRVDAFEDGKNKSFLESKKQ